MKPNKKKVSISISSEHPNNGRDVSETSVTSPTAFQNVTGGAAQLAHNISEIEESNQNIGENSSQSHLRVSTQRLDETDSAERGDATRVFPHRGTIIYPLWRKLSMAASGVRTPRIVKRIRQRRIYLVWIMAILQGIILIVSYFINYATFDSYVAQKPKFSWMLGPNTETLMRMGSRFQPCMRSESILPPDQTSTGVLCFLPSNKTNDSQLPRRCFFDELCLHFVGARDAKALEDKFQWQWLRFITPIFLHGGLWHYLMNALIHVTTLNSLETAWGFWRIFIIYMVSGVFGFVFGAVYGKPTVSATGSSGAIYGLMACFIIDTAIHWAVLKRPVWRLVKIFGVMGLMMVVAVLPGMDNFSHIGGFFVGFLSGITLMPSITLLPLQRRPSVKKGRSTPMVRSICIIIIRVTAFVSTVFLYSTLFSAFYNRTGASFCSWCSKLECISVFGSCQLQF